MDYKIYHQIARNLKLDAHLGGSFEDDGDSQDDICYRLANKLSSLDAKVTHGVSKMVIILPDAPLVMKIPFTGFWMPESYLDEEELNNSDKYTYYDEWREAYWQPFCGASSTRPDDYCNTELEIYQEAVELGIGDFFAETDFFTFDLSGNRIYLQEKVTPRLEMTNENLDTHTPSAETRSRIRTISEESSYSPCYCEEWLAECLEWYGEEKYMKFIEFSKKWSLNSDLHNGNLGYREDGSPCILDSSGFYD